MHAETAFRQQEVAQHEARTLETVGKVEDFGDHREAIADVQRSSNHSRIIAKSGTQHLPQVALLGFRGNTRGRARSLAVDHHYWSFDHRGHAQDRKSTRLNSSHRCNSYAVF